MRDLDRLIAAARRHGHDVGIYAERLLDDLLPWTRMRAVYRLLGLAVDAHAIDPACARDGRAALPSPDAAATIFRAEAGSGAGDPPTPSSLRL
jgi:hypothetical protein